METNVTHQMPLPELPKAGEKQMDKLYISRKAAMLALMYEADTHLNPVKKAYTRASAIIEQMAAEDVQPVIHAYWIELPKALNPNENPCKCSNCGHVLSFMNYYPKSKYCPNCGAKMDGDVE